MSKKSSFATKKLDFLLMFFGTLACQNSCMKQILRLRPILPVLLMPSVAKVPVQKMSPTFSDLVSLGAVFSKFTNALHSWALF